MSCRRTLKLAGAWLFLALAGPACAQLLAPDAVPDTLVQRLKACTACHGAHGEGGGHGYHPRIAGKPALYLERQLRNFRDGHREHPLMEHMVDGLPDAYLREIAAWFAAQQPPHEPQPAARWPQALLDRGEALVRAGDPARDLPACQACHGKTLTGVEPATPALIGLPADYVSAQLGAWRSHTRGAPAPDCMAEVADRLSRADTQAVAAWLASQPLPEDPAALPAGSVDPPLRCGSLAP